ncbi:Hypothetical_protein [Hexamita inflata]|uniref:Hypothetical_protein n=1 Tax=Hexamita inflata TaxID=28002 RepID=A0AA86NP82_9EUKA|nr:Hypothetical protein HINF_LOCUS10888 [Hexamita inflata]
MNNGILIVRLENKNLVIVDLYNLKMIDFQDLALGQCGLNLNKQIIEKYLGTGFEQQQNELYNQQMNQQMQFPCYQEEIYKIVPFTLILEQFKIQFSERLTKNLENINTFKNQYYNPKLNNLIKIQSIMALSFQQFLDSEIDQ